MKKGTILRRLDQMILCRFDKIGPYEFAYWMAWGPMTAVKAGSGKPTDKDIIIQERVKMENKRYKLIQDEDGTLTLIIPEGVRST